MVEAAHGWGKLVAEAWKVHIRSETQVHAGSREGALRWIRIYGVQVLMLLAHVSGQHGECVMLKRYHDGGGRMQTGGFAMTLSKKANSKRSDGA